MLRRLRIKNFKLLRDVDLEIESGRPTVLIGPNAAGKSTVIEVLDFLSRCALDGLERALAAHGGMYSIRTAGVQDPVEIETTWAFHDGAPPHLPNVRWEVHWGLSITTNTTGRGFVQSESLTAEGQVLVSTDGTGIRWVNAEDEGAPKPDRVLDPSMLAWSAFAHPTQHASLGLLKRIVASSRVLGGLSAVPSWALSSPDRASPRDALVIATQPFVGREGIGLANALYNLSTDHAEAWKRLEQAFRAEFPFVKRIFFPADPGGSRISVALEDERFPGRKIYASEMSDGMVVFLCLLTLILQPEQFGVLALDEPDAHLHPSALRRFLAMGHERHGRRALIVVTHSNALLDELQDPAKSVRIVEATKEGARIRRLDREALKAWRSEYSLSELRRTGLLDPPNTAYANGE